MSFNYDYQRAAQSLEMASLRTPSSLSLEKTLYHLFKSYVALGQANLASVTLMRYQNLTESPWYLQARTLQAILLSMDEEVDRLLEERRLLGWSDKDLRIETIKVDHGLLQSAFSLDDEYQHTSEAVIACAIAKRALGLAASPSDSATEDSLPEMTTTLLQQIKKSSGASRQLHIDSLAVLSKILFRQGAPKEAERVRDFIASQVQTDSPALWKSLLALVEGEQMISIGQIAEGLQLLNKALSTQESFQIHESLAHVFNIAEDYEAATREYKWLLNHRGRALIESQYALGQIHNVMSWNLALFHIGQISEMQNRPDKAIEYYQRFVDRWKNGDPSPQWNEASERLEALKQLLRQDEVSQDLPN